MSTVFSCDSEIDRGKQAMNGLNLLVTMTDKRGSFGRTPLTAACRGHNDMGTVLNYFLYEASKEAQNKGIDRESVEFITLERSQERILEELHGAVKSKKTLTLYSRKFQEWEFVDSDPYHHIYKVYFRNIQKAIDNPPPADPPKPRGIHGKKDDVNDTNGKNTISPNGKFTPDERDAKIAFLEAEMVKMRFQMVNLRSEMVKMRFQMVNLPFEKSSKEAPEAALSDVVEPLDSLRLLEITREDICVSSDTPHTQNPPTSSSQLGENDGTLEGNSDTSMASIHDPALAHSDNPANGNADIDTDVQKEVKETLFPIDGATTGKRLSNNKRRKSKVEPSLTDTTPIPPPEKPSEDEPWTPLTCMKLADHYRGSVLRKSTRVDSDYQKATKAAVALVNQQQKTYQEVDTVFRFMLCLDKGKDGEIYDDWWEGKVVDLWHLEKHCTGKLKEIQIKKIGLLQDLNGNVTPFRQSGTLPINKARVFSSYDDPDYVDNSFYGQGLTLEKAVAKGAN